jgi:uncharacterized protein YciI
MAFTCGMKALAFLCAAVLAAGPARGAPAAAPAPYYIVFLRPDPARLPLSKEEGRRIMGAHMANIQGMADRGVLSAAGPMDDSPPRISGIFVLKSGSPEEARRIASMDPTVVGRRNTIDVHVWRGPVGIGEAYFARAKEHPGGGPAMNGHAFCIVSRGPAWKAGPGPLDEHARFVESLRASGMLAAAGPVEGDPDLLAIVIFKTPSVVDAKTIMGDDPPVRAGLFSVEYHQWRTADLVLPW